MPCLRTGYEELKLITLVSYICKYQFIIIKWKSTFVACGLSSNLLLVFDLVNNPWSVVAIWMYSSWWRDIPSSKIIPLCHIAILCCFFQVWWAFFDSLIWLFWPAKRQYHRSLGNLLSYGSFSPVNNWNNIKADDTDSELRENCLCERDYKGHFRKSRFLERRK